MQAIFNDDSAPVKAQTLLVFAPTATTKIEDNNAPAQLVGLIRIFEGANWSPALEKSTLSYAPANDAAAKKDDS